jgi:UDP-N-acetylglucosamine 2-epimerase
LHRELSKKFGNFSTVLTSRLPKEHFLEENILYKPKDFLDIMSISEIIICNAGLLLLEASYLNKSIICLPQNVYEEKFVHNLAKKYPKVVVANTLKDVTRQIEFVKSKMSKYQYDFTFSAKGFSKVLEIVETVSND